MVTYCFCGGVGREANHRDLRGKRAHRECAQGEPGRNAPQAGVLVRGLDLDWRSGIAPIQLAGWAGVGGGISLQP
jgi:hypothetical protein